MGTPYLTVELISLLYQTYLCILYWPNRAKTTIENVPNGWPQKCLNVEVARILPTTEMTSHGGLCDVTDKIVLVHLVTVQMTLEQKWRHMGACVTSRTILALPTGRRTKYNIYRVVPTPSQPADHRNGWMSRLLELSWPRRHCATGWLQKCY